jgi:L-glyceraldehyde 3-phosphate reductase
LAQGLLTDRYLQGKLPVNSRVVKPHGYLKKEALTTAKLAILHQLNDFAGHRGQSLAAMSLAWVLHQSAVTSVLIGASCVDQVEANLACLESPSFSSDELEEILAIVQNEGEDRG